MAATSPPPAWLSALQRLAVRQGAIDVAPDSAPETATPRVVSHDDDTLEATNRINWRVRLLKLDAAGLVIERPYSAHHPVVLKPGDDLVALVAEGPTRWSLTCRVVEQFTFPLNERQNVLALRLASPHAVSDAQRRAHFRVETAATPMPPVSVWRLVDPASARGMERYNQLMHRAHAIGGNEPPRPHFPQITDAFTARIIDLSGGGVCLSAPLNVKPLLETNPALWLRIALPGYTEPFYAAAKLAHWHLESTLLVQLGLSFTFEHNPPHQRFISDELCRFATQLQRLQLQRTR